MQADDPELERELEEAPRPSLDGLPVVGFTRRRVAVVVAGLFAIWLVGVFARQVGDASAAANQADQMRARNEAVSRDVASLQAELELVQKPAFVAEMARGYRLGAPGEVPFTIDPKAAPLPANAPGSEGIGSGDAPPAVSPFEAWLQVLFGSQP